MSKEKKKHKREQKKEVKKIGQNIHKIDNFSLYFVCYL